MPSLTHCCCHSHSQSAAPIFFVLLPLLLHLG
jgi:hypothetical protein